MKKLLIAQMCYGYAMKKFALGSQAIEEESTHDNEDYTSDEEDIKKEELTYPNPLQNSPTYSVVKQHPVDPNNVIAKDIVVHFHQAGPRERVYFQSDDMHAGVVTCGGLCLGLYIVIREIVCGLGHMYGVQDNTGIEAGYRKIYAHSTIPLTPKVVNDFYKYGGTILGTPHGGHETSKTVDSIQDCGINQVYIIMDDGNHKGSAVTCKKTQKCDSKVAVVEIPKTIDNNIAFIGKSFGFDMTVREDQCAKNAAQVEAESIESGIDLVKFRGCYNGYIAMYSTLATRDVDCCLIPESSFYLEGKGDLYEFIETCLEEGLVSFTAKGDSLFLAVPNINKHELNLCFLGVMWTVFPDLSLLEDKQYSGREDYHVPDPSQP